MLHPSYTDLMKVVNKDVEEGETKVVNSRYSIVLAAAKRARQEKNQLSTAVIPSLWLQQREQERLLTDLCRSLMQRLAKSRFLLQLMR